MKCNGLNKIETNMNLMFKLEKILQTTQYLYSYT
jgi:hypothetical protein